MRRILLASFFLDMLYSLRYFNLRQIYAGEFTMSRAPGGWMAVTLAVGGYLQAVGLQSSGPVSSATSPHREALNRYCVVRHAQASRNRCLRPS